MKLYEPSCKQTHVLFSMMCQNFIHHSSHSDSTTDFLQDFTIHAHGNNWCSGFHYRDLGLSFSCCFLQATNSYTNLYTTTNPYTKLKQIHLFTAGFIPDMYTNTQLRLIPNKGQAIRSSSRTNTNMKRAPLSE